MTLSTLWLDELDRQKERLETDFISRMLGVMLTCALMSLFLPVRFIFWLYVVIVLTEGGNAFLFSQIRKRPAYVDILYAALLLNVWAGMCAFSFIGTLVSGLPDPLVKLSGVLSLVGALISVSTSRAVHLPFGIISGIPPSAALIWIASRGWDKNEGLGNSAFATIAVIGLIGYFGSALVQNYVTQTRLAQALGRANAASRAKSRFLSEMNHEMRTPLNTILGLSQTMSDHTSHADLSDRASEIELAARTLQMLIEDVLDLAAAEEGNIVFRPVTTVIRHEMNAVARVLSGVHSSGPDMVSVQVASDVSEVVRIDPLLLRKCLLRVASMFPSPDANSQLHAMTLSCRNGSDSTLVIRLRVGSKHEQMAPPGPNGHYLVSELAERLASTMHARLLFTHNAGVLESAEMVLPYAPVASLPTTTASIATRRLLALVVDDISTNRFVVAQMLKSLAMDAIEAESGKSALDALSQHRFDLVLLDMNMPAMNGEQTFRAIRGSQRDWASVPIIALTADAQPEQRDKYLSLGIDGYVAKPVDSRLLWAEIAACVPTACNASA